MAASPSAALARPTLSLDTSSQLFPNLPPRAASLSVPPFPMSSSPPSSAELSPSPPTSPLSLFVTFKVLRLVNSFRQRMKSRRVGRSHVSKEKASPGRVRRDFCQVFEKKAFEEVEYYLGRKKRRSASKGLKILPVLNRKTTVVNKPDGEDPRNCIEKLLRQIDRSTNDDTSLDSIARNDKLFFRREADFDVKPLSLAQLARVDVVINDLLETIKRVSTRQSKVKTLVEGNELLDTTLDETYLANLEHLLWTLREQILRHLVAHLIELAHRHLIECQKDEDKHADFDWFAEFPDSRHPLSTTWPWSIKPSLAVIWGVCWMFYGYFDSMNNWVDQMGNIIFTAEQIRESMARPQRSIGRASAETIATNNRRNNNNIVRPNTTTLGIVGGGVGAGQTWSASDLAVTGVGRAQPHVATAGATGVLGLRPEQPRRESRHHGRTEADAHTDAIPTVGLVGYMNTTAPSAYAEQRDPDFWLPQENFNPNFASSSLATSTTAPFQSTASSPRLSSTYAAELGAWSRPHNPLDGLHPTDLHLPVAQTSPPQARNPSTPAIRITTDHSGLQGFPSTPLNRQYYSESPASPFSRSELGVSTNNYCYSRRAATLSPHNYTTPFSGPLVSYGPNNAMNAPMSPISTPNSVHDGHQDGALNHQISRKRSHEEMTSVGDVDPMVNVLAADQQQQQSHQQPQQQDDTQNGSLGASPNADMPYSPPRGRTFKRGDPPVNGSGKYLCGVSQECQNLTFDRKCEWSKHMDKHDRPYQCQDPQCAKLQGFTYSGGLLRHEREVHGKHGGPKAQLFCPYRDCKRSSGKGFTRKENLQEHTRRVHSNQSQPITQSNNIGDLGDNTELTEFGGTPASDVRGNDDFSGPPTKRQRSDNGNDEVEELKMEVQRLRAENMEIQRLRAENMELQHLRADNTAKDERIRLMEAAEATRAIESRQMEENLRQMQGMHQLQQQIHEESQQVGHGSEHPM